MIHRKSDKQNKSILVEHINEDELLINGKAFSVCSTFLLTLFEFLSSCDKISDIFCSIQRLLMAKDADLCPKLFEAEQEYVPTMELSHFETWRT